MEAQAPFPVDLTNCDREPIHIPGAIQPHGVLFALQEPALTITQVSENIGSHLGLRAEDVLGGPLSAVLEGSSTERVRAALSGGRWDELNPLSLVAAGRPFDGIVHRHDGVAIVELEPATALPSERSAHHALRSVLIGAQAARTLPELCQTVVREVRRMTGFERVMLYRFDEDGHGSVEAEAREPALEPYLGLHYPASDIPRQARQLYLKNWTRLIPDAHGTPARLSPPLRPDTRSPLDLGFSVLRAVSPIHIEYMKSMGVRASMSVSLIVGDRLWGLITCAHHTGPRLVPYELRSACEVLGRLTSLQIGALEEREAAARRASRRATQEALVDAMRACSVPYDVLESLLDRPAELLALVDAGGAAVWTGDEPSTCGHTPPKALVGSLSAWLDERGALGVFSTSSLPEIFPAALSAKDVASGLSTFALPGSPSRRVMWFRPEIVQIVSWGGDPYKPVETDTANRIHPRRSFELWKEEVRLRSSRWTANDIEAVEDLRRSAVEIDLERQIERAQRAIRARDDMVAVVSHDLKSPLSVIRMQAGLLLQMADREDVDAQRRLRTVAERIQRPADRMASLIHDLLDLAKIEAGRIEVQRRPEDARAMIEEALVIHRPLADAKGITITEELLEAPQVSADRERIFQVISNLVGNAVKFTPERGTVTVRVEPAAGDVLFTVADTGPGIPADQLPHVFNRYWQARHRSREGSGLGLFIAKGIIEAHGGDIRVESPPGGGARFMFSLPTA